MSFVRAANPIWYMVDHIGQPLNDEYYAHFLTNTLPYIPQNVYRDPQGVTVWTGNVVQFQPSGTLPNNLYFDPTLTYRIEIRRGISQSDPLIWEINNFVPGNGSSVTPVIPPAIYTSENQASNTVFSEVYFVPTLTSSLPTITFTAAGTYDIAPGWQLVLAGVGSTTLTQRILSASQTTSVNPVPPFALKIDSSGWNNVSLVQRLQKNGGIWAEGAVAMSITGQAEVDPETVTLLYQPSSVGAGTPVTVASGSFGIGAYTTIKGAVNVGHVDNVQLNDVAYVDMIIQLPTTGIVNISNVQVTGQTAPLATAIPAADAPDYQQESDNRMIDHLFHLYRYSLLRQSKDSLLVGWNFGLNPWQFRTTALSNVATNEYTADQTIVIQQAYVATGVGNNVSVGRSTFNGDNFSIQFTAVTANNQFAILQYIDPTTIRPYWSYPVSVYVNAFLDPSNAIDVQFKMRLIYKAGLPNTVSQTDPIASWVAGSDPVAAVGYTLLAPPNDPIYTMPADNSVSEFFFDGIVLPNSTNVDMTLGVLIYTVSNMDETGTPDIVFFHDVSLTPTDFAIASPAKTFDQVLRECQFYYEKSYNVGVLAGTATNNGLRYASVPFATDGSSTVMYKNSYQIVYQGVKRVPPAVTFYAPDGTIDTVQLAARAGDGTTPAPTAGSNPSNTPIIEWTAFGATIDSVIMRPNNLVSVMTFASTEDSKQGEIYYHYVADSRLGV